MIPFTADVGPYLPHFFSETDPRPAKEQIDEAYAHGGGWSPFGKGKWKLEGWTRPGAAKLTYPGDPPFHERARAILHTETLILFPADFLAVVQADGSFEVMRID